MFGNCVSVKRDELLNGNFYGKDRIINNNTKEQRSWYPNSIMFKLKHLTWKVIFKKAITRGTAVDIEIQSWNPKHLTLDNIKQK